MGLASLFFAACAFVLAHEARTNTQGLIIDGVIRLGPDGATRFYWALTAASAAFVLVGVPAMILSLVTSRVVELTPTTLAVPSLWSSSAPVTIQLSSIQSLSTQVVKRQEFLIVRHAGGKATIVKSHLPDAAAYERLCTEIARRSGEAGRRAAR